MKLSAPIAAAILSVSPCAIATAQSDAEGERIGFWQISCTDGPCRAFVSIARGDDLAVAWTILRDPEDGSATSLIRVPNGVALPPGLRVYADEETFFDAAFQVCEADGCTAILEMTDEVLAAFEGVDVARVGYILYGEQATTAYEIPVEQMGEAIDAL